MAIGAARLGSARSDRAAASRASPAAAARRALCAPSRGPPLRRHAPPRPALCLLYSANNRESARRAVFPLDSLFIIPRPHSQEFVQRNRGRDLKRHLFLVGLRWGSASTFEFLGLRRIPNCQLGPSPPLGQKRWVLWVTPRISGT